MATCIETESGHRCRGPGAGDWGLGFNGAERPLGKMEGPGDGPRCRLREGNVLGALH